MIPFPPELALAVSVFGPRGLGRTDLRGGDRVGDVERGETALERSGVAAPDV